MERVRIEHLAGANPALLMFHVERGYLSFPKIKTRTIVGQKTAQHRTDRTACSTWNKNGALVDRTPSDHGYDRKQSD